MWTTHLRSKKHTGATQVSKREGSKTKKGILLQWKIVGKNRWGQKKGAAAKVTNRPESFEKKRQHSLQICGVQDRQYQAEIGSGEWPTDRSDLRKNIGTRRPQRGFTDINNSWTKEVQTHGSDLFCILRWLDRSTLIVKPEVVPKDRKQQTKMRIKI